LLRLQYEEQQSKAFACSRKICRCQFVHDLERDSKDMYEYSLQWRDESKEQSVNITYLTFSVCQSSHASPILGGREAPGAPPAGSSPVFYSVKHTRHEYTVMLFFPSTFNDMYFSEWVIVVITNSAFPSHIMARIS
jgi:hypothetical protein